MDRLYTLFVSATPYFIFVPFHTLTPVSCSREGALVLLMLGTELKAGIGECCIKKKSALSGSACDVAESPQYCAKLECSDTLLIFHTDK